MMRAIRVVGLLVAVLLSPALAEERYVVKDHGISFVVPEGFSEQKCGGNVVAEFANGDPETGELFEIRYVKAQPPRFLRDFVDSLKDYNSKAFKDSHIVSEKDLVVGGAKASQRVMSYSTSLVDKVLMETVISRSPMRYYVVDMLVRKVAYDRFANVYDKLISSFVFEDIKFMTDEEKAYKNTIALLDGLSDVNKELFGEKWYLLTAKDKKVGYFWRKISPIEVSSKRGYLIETEQALFARTGDSAKTTTKSEVSFDFKIQKVNWTNVITKGIVSKTVVLKGDLSNGMMNLEREINGEKESVKVDIKSGTFLPDAIDVFKQVTAPLPRGKYLALYLPLGENSPIYDLVEVWGKSWNEGSDVYILYTNRERYTNITDWYDENKNLVKEIVAGSPIIIKAATKEEALK